MGFTDTDIHSAGRANATQLRRAIVERGQRLAADFAPDGQFHIPPAGVEDVLLAEAAGTYGGQYSLNVDGWLAQINEETAGMQSAMFLTKANPGGIGAEDGHPERAVDFTKGGTVPFADAVRAGLHAHACHLRTYRFGAGPWTADDPRFANVPAAWLGSVRTFAQLQGKWATSSGYTTDLEAIWSALDAIVREGPLGPDRYADLDGIRVDWIPAPDGNHGGAHAPEYTWIVIHDIEGSGPSGISTLTTPGRQASVQFVNDALNGRIAQLVGTRTEAWGAGNDNANGRGLHIENPGYAGKPYDPRVVNACGRMVGILARDFGIPLLKLTAEQFAAGMPGVLGHGDVTPQRGPRSDWHWDPGPTWPWEQMLSVARQVAGAPGGAGGSVYGPLAPAAPGPFFPETGFGILGGIAAEWQATGGLTIHGYPRSRELDVIEDGKPLRVQWFQRSRAEWSPGRWPDHHDVTWRLLGDDVLFAPLDFLAGYRFHITAPDFQWAFTAQTAAEWAAKGHAIPPGRSLF